LNSSVLKTPSRISTELVAHDHVRTRWARGGGVGGGRKRKKKKKRKEKRKACTTQVPLFKKKAVQFFHVYILRVYFLCNTFGTAPRDGTYRHV
jgi:hypothetical protein